MKKYVYKITNLINNKVYIGQTNNLKRRFQEHLHDKRCNHPVHNALVKYGKENFKYEVLYFGENYNSEEKKWIKYYNSQNKKFGYNIVEGGQDSSGEDNPMAKITQNIADIVIDYLLNSNLSFNEIANKLNISITYINHINNGESWAKPLYKYPLRVNRIQDELYYKIIDILKNTDINFTEIGKMFNLDRSIIQNINIGKTYKKDNINYPIRKRFIDVNTAIKIKDLLRNTKMYYKDIADITDSTISIVSKINYGTAWNDNTEEYPIRK